MKTTKPLVSIIITNYNGKKYLKKCFDSLFAQTYPNIEIILADDCSFDDSVSFTKKFYPKIKVAINSKNSGLAVNSNNGAKLATGKYFFFYNNDTTTFPNFIEELVKKAESDAKIGVVGAMWLPYKPSDDKNLTEDQKDIGMGSDIYGGPCLAKKAGHVFYPDAAMFMRAHLFKMIGGFDPDFLLYGEDMDICWRVHLMGYKVVIATDAKFRHDTFCSQRLNGKIVTTYKRRYLVERQTINKILKYYSWQTLLWLLPKFIFFYTLESLFFVFVRPNLKMFWKVYVKAVWWNIIKLPSTLRNRKFIQKIRKKDDSYILSLMYKGYAKINAVLQLGLPIIK